MKLIGALLILSVVVAGCSQQDTEKTKQEAAQATEKIKEESKTAAVELKKDAKEVARQTKAIADGVKEGLETPDKPVNVNSASKNKLQTLPGVDEPTAERIIARRPYHTRNQIVAKGAVSPEEFKEIKDKVVVK
jgi:DNA uptake protein ComE-like DNA-binding protein